MFRLKKLQPPFGSANNPLVEASYSEGLITVVDGFCEVQLPETRDRLLKLGYEAVEDTIESGDGGDDGEGHANKKRGSGRRR